MSDFNERLHDLLKNLAKIGDVSKEARDEITKHLKPDKSTESSRKNFKKALFSLTNHLFEEVANLKKDLSLLKLETDEPKNKKSIQDDTNTQCDKESLAEEFPKKHLTEENKENEEETPNTSEINSTDELSTNISETKPLLKIIDFSKLVDPRNLELMDRNHKRKQNQNKVSVIVLSSDEDSVSETASKNQKLKVAGPSHCNVDNRKGSNRSIISTSKPLKNISDSQNSGKHKSTNCKSTDKFKKSSNSRCESVNDGNMKSIVVNDVKFKGKPYVKLLRIPCEQMKEYYSTHRVCTENSVANSKFQEEKLQRTSILDEKTGELVNSGISNEEHPERSEISKNIISKKKQKSKLSEKKKQQKGKSEITNDSEAPSLPEKSDDSCVDIPLKFVSSRKKKTKDGSKTTKDSEKSDDSCEDSTSKFVIKRNKKTKGKLNKKKEDDKSRSEIKSTVEDNETTENNSNKMSNKSSKDVPENTCDVNNETEIVNKKMASNSDKKLRNKVSIVLPVPLSDSDTDYLHEENLNESEKVAKQHDKDAQVTDSDSDGKCLGGNKNNEDSHLSNSSCEDTNEKSQKSSDIKNTSINEKGVKSSKKKKDKGSKLKIAEDEIFISDGKSKNKSRNEIGNAEKLSEVEEPEIVSQNVRHQHLKINQTESEKSSIDETSSDENISGVNKNRAESADKININKKEKIKQWKQIPQEPCQSDEDMFDNSSQEKNEETQDKEEKHSNSDLRSDSSGDEKDGQNDDSVDSDSSQKETKKFGKTRKPHKIISDNEEEITENKNQESSDTDEETNRKRKRSGKQSSDKDNSDDSEDFSAFHKRNKMRHSRKTKKKIKGLISDSEEDKNEKKSEHSESDSENIESNEESGNNSSSEIEIKKTRTKKRRIIKMNDDSDSSDTKTTRKKIKKVISKDSLSESTKQAAAEEKERKQRIAEKQKKYNQIYENIDIASSKVDKLVLDIDEKTEKPLLEVSKFLVSKLKPHQASGIQFMWDACFESLERAEKSAGSGCILAHCMGLGKTLQVIALSNTLIEGADKTKIKKVLVVTPLSTVLNWKAEFQNWLSGDEDYDIYELVTCKPQNAERSYYIKQWHENGGVMIMSYSMFRNLSNDKNKKISKRIRDIFIEGLVDPGPDLVICDEGHLLKNEKTSISIAMNKIKTRRRIVLTGTPLQNNLKEYYCMVQFVKPNLLGTYKEYLNRFVNPITNGQYIDSTEYDINIMRRRSHVLHKLLDGIVQRRDYAVLAPYLPPKYEYILFLTLTETQKKLYSHYLENFARRSKDDGSNKTSYLFQDFQAFSRICIHPRVLLDKSVDNQNKYQSDEESAGSLKNFIDDGSDSSSTTESSASGSDGDEDGEKKGLKKKESKRVTRAQKATGSTVSDSEEEETEKEWWQQYCDGDELDNLGNSSKLLVLFEILKECEQIGDKVLVFSQSLYALNAIEYFLEKVDQATQNGDAEEKTCGFTGSWTPGLDYFRLDGSTNCNLRSNWCNTFNKESNSRARLFLLSTRAGGLGINLVAANRVIIFDVSWNPSSDLQSIYRVYRFGQLKPSYIYRFVIYGTMEMKIYERQVTKQAISKRVIDEQQIDRHYNQNDLAELYKFDQPSIEDRPIPLVPQDVLLAELLQQHEDKIFKYHEHQSLLANKEDETLNEEERKAAWEEFENEKVERTKQPLIGKFSLNTVQLALKSIIQRDNPTWNNNQILSIIPQLIQQLHIQLSAKDMTMYNRIAAEVKHMQEEYNRKMQMQFYQYQMQLEAQRRQHQHLGILSSQMPPFGNYQQIPRFMHNPGFNPSVPSSSTINPTEVVELN